MAALDFPSASASPWVAPNGAIYTYIGTSPNGYWEANTANASQNLTDLFVEKSGSTMTGALKLDNAGSVSLPDISFDGDVNTGLYSPGADSLGIVTGGSLRISVNGIGQVQIPGLLDCTNSISGVNYVATSNGTATNPAYRFPNLGIGLFTTSGGVSIATNATERLTIDNAGAATFSGTIISGGNPNAGAARGTSINEYGTVRAANTSGNIFEGYTVNTATATSSINADGSALFGATVSLQGSGAQASVNVDGDDLTFKTIDPSGGAQQEGIRIIGGTDAGNVGIGTASPTHQLTVHNASTTGGTIEANRFSARDNYGSASGLGNGIFSPASNTLAFATNSAERMRIFSDGGVNIKKYLEFRNQGDTTQAGYLGNAADLVISGSANDFALRAEVNLLFSTSGSTERMRINSAGLVGIGTANPIDENGFSQAVNLNGPSGCSYVAKANNSSTNCGQFGYYGTTCYMINKAAGACVFYTTNAEHAQVSATGHFHASPAGAGNYFGKGSLEFHSFDQATTAQWIAGFRSQHASTPYGIYINYSQASPNSTSSQFIYCSDSSSLKLSVKSNGGIENFSGNNTNLCDEREKKNIVSLETKWDKVKNWELRKFHYNEDADTDDLRYGVIAQEVEIENPELITDFTKQRAEDAVLDEDGTVVTPAKEEILRKGVKEQQMMWMSIKALQEAMAKIETLEAKVAALESA